MDFNSRFLDDDCFVFNLFRHPDDDFFLMMFFYLQFVFSF